MLMIYIHSYVDINNVNQKNRDEGQSYKKKKNTIFKFDPIYPFKKLFFEDMFFNMKVHTTRGLLLWTLSFFSLRHTNSPNVMCT